MADVFSIVTLLIGIAGVLAILWVIRDGDSARHAEDAARVFYEEHGRWPDQTPEEAEAERRRLEAALAAPAPVVLQPDDDGRV